MAKWAELSRDILSLISAKLADVSDHYRFSCVCNSWRIVALEYRKRYLPCNLPGLMIPGINCNNRCKTRRFLSFPLCKNINQELQLPKLSVPHINLCRGSFEGWLVMINDDMSMYVFNPFSGVCIDLPPVTSLPKPHLDRSLSKWSIYKAILSANPSTSTDCFVLIIYACHELAFCKLGDKTWRCVDYPESYGYPLDAIYYKGQFYVVDNCAYVFVCNLTAGQLKLTLFDPQPKGIHHVQRWYLVESNGELLLIFREIGIQNERSESSESEHSDIENDNYDLHDYFIDKFPTPKYKTTHFEVFKLDTSSSHPEWFEVKNLDGQAIFFGFNQSFSLSKLQLSSFKGNCIYFTDDHLASHRFYRHSGYDVGVFHLENSTIEPLYLTDAESTKPPAMWVTPMP